MSGAEICFVNVVTAHFFVFFIGAVSGVQIFFVNVVTAHFFLFLLER